MPKFSWRHIELQRSVAYSLDFFHMMAHLFEHPPDLPVLPFNQGYLIPGIVGLTNGDDLGWSSLRSSAALGLDEDSRTQFGQALDGRRAGYLYELSLGDV